MDRWNWGAFLLSWIWGLGNRVYIALLGLIPGVGVVMPFVLGAKGSIWAWRNKRWESVGHFRRVQRRWAIWGACVSGVAVTVVIIAVALEAPAPDAPLEQVVASDDGELSMTVPSDWTIPTDLSKRAALQAEHPFEELYVVVLDHPRSDFIVDLSVQDFARTAARDIAREVKEGEVVSGPERLSISGAPAIRHHIRGAFEGVRIEYIHTSIEGRGSFLEVIAWTVPSLLDEYGPLLRRITATVTQTSGR